jgi:hypothetical protein
LVELVTVVAIIAMLLALALPSFRNLNLSGQYSEVQAKLASLTTTAMIPSYEQKTGLLITRARKHDMIRPGADPSADFDNPALPYQQVRVVTRAPYPDDPVFAGDISAEDFAERPFYRLMDRTKPTQLTELTWLAPDYSVALQADGTTPELNDDQFADQRLFAQYTEMFPVGGPAGEAESLVNAFFIVYDQGECVREPAGAPSSPNLVFSFVNNAKRAYKGSGPTASYNPNGTLWINHYSARGAYVYDRTRLLEISRGTDSDTAEGRRTFLREQSKALYCTRYGGNLVTGPVSGR